jgi:hypothetical protein
MELLGTDDQGSQVFLGQKSLLVTNVAQKLPTEQVNPREIKTKKWAPWGSDNKYPQRVIKEISDVSLVSPILDWKARALYGNGLAYGILKIDEETGKETFLRKFDPEIEAWLEATDAMQYLMEASHYFYHFYNIFPEMIQSIDGKRIVYLSCLESTDVRWKRREIDGKNKGIITKAYVNPDWNQIANESDMDIIDVLNTRMDPLGAARQWKNKKFIYPISYPTPGRSYYQNAPWHVLLSTWLPLARKIPAFKQALLDNQLAIKYLIIVPDWWWSWKYPDFNKKSEKERLALVQKEVKDFNSFMSGAENAGKSMMMVSKSDDGAHKYKDWDIKVIDDKFKEGIYLEDSQEADAHIYKNLNVDPTLFGAGAGKNSQSTGSGSDKRVAWNNYIIMTKPHQDIILKPLHFIAKYNGWADRLQAQTPNSKFTFMFQNYMIAKLDSGAETTPVDASTN